MSDTTQDLSAAADDVLLSVLRSLDLAISRCGATGKTAAMIELSSVIHVLGSVVQRRGIPLSFALDKVRKTLPQAVAAAERDSRADEHESDPWPVQIDWSRDGTVDLEEDDIARAIANLDAGADDEEIEVALMRHVGEVIDGQTNPIDVYMHDEAIAVARAALRKREEASS